MGKHAYPTTLPEVPWADSWLTADEAKGARNA